MKNLDKLDILKAYQTKEDRYIISNVFEKLVASEYQAEYTDFLDPAKASKFLSLVENKTHSRLLAFGGYEGAERVMLGFFPDYEKASFDKFPIDTIKIEYNSKYSKDLGHRDFLGSILGLGIERSKLGDIIVLENAALAFAARDISGYIVSSLLQVSKTKVSTEIYHEEIDEFLPNPSESRITVASMRLDALVSEAFNISRGKASDYIAAEKVYVNWSPALNSSKKINEGDIITLRGKGRIKISEISGLTKKNRVSLTILKY